MALTVNCEKDDSIVMPGPESASMMTERATSIGVGSGVSKGDPSRVFFFGTAVSNAGGELIVEIAQPKADSREVVGQWVEVLPGRGIKGTTMRVAVDDKTSLVLGDGGLEGLEAGTPIMVGGVLSDGALSGHFVIDIRHAKQYMPSAVEEREVGPSMEWQVVNNVDLTPPPGVFSEIEDLLGRTDEETVELGVDDISTALTVKEFPGKLGGPAWLWDQSLGITLIDLLLLEIELDRVVLTVGLGGGEYDFPFSFEADGTAPLFVGQDGDLQVQVQPQGRDPFSYYWALGFNVAITIDVWVPIAGWNDYTHDFNLFSVVNQTTDPAPMPGQLLNVDAVACPSFDVSFGVLDVLGLEFCEEQVFRGDYFYSDLAIENCAGLTDDKCFSRSATIKFPVLLI